MYNVEFYDEDGDLSHNANVRTIEELLEVANGRQCKIVDHGEMSHEDAMIIVNGWGDVNGLTGTLEILTKMKDYRRGNELTNHQDHAFDVVFGGMRKLFLGDEA